MSQKLIYRPQDNDPSDLVEFTRFCRHRLEELGFRRSEANGLLQARWLLEHEHPAYADDVSGPRIGQMGTRDGKRREITNWGAWSLSHHDSMVDAGASYDPVDLIMLDDYPRVRRS